MAKLTTDVKLALEIFVNENVDNFMEWLRAIEQPEKKCEIFLKVLQYYLPKLSQVSGTVNVKHSLTDFTDEELALIATQPITDALTELNTAGSKERPN